MSRAEQIEACRSTAEIMDAKLQALQGPLSELIQRADVVFEEVFPRAPHPSRMPREFPIFATQYEHMSPDGLPKVRELTVHTSTHEWLRIFKDSGTGYRDMMIWSNRPHGFHMRRTVVQKFPEDIDYPLPYHIDVATWDPQMTRYLKHVDDVLVHPNKYINITHDQLEQALRVAGQYL